VHRENEHRTENPLLPAERRGLAVAQGSQEKDMFRFFYTPNKSSFGSVMLRSSADDTAGPVVLLRMVLALRLISEVLFKFVLVHDCFPRVQFASAP
jgi:hypothetical protein